jgi:hypothetical protein
LVFGPLQVGRISVARLQHNDIPNIALTPAPSVPAEVDINPPPVNAEPEQEVPAEILPVPVDSEVIAPQPIEPAPVQEEVPTQAAERILMTVSANVLNVRAQATVDSAVVAKLGKDAKVWAYPDEAIGLWMKIKFDDKTGYASARFMTNAN